MSNIKKLKDFQILEILSEDGYVLVEENGVAKKIPLNKFSTGEELDPTVPEWAKAETKPTYDKTEVGLGNVDNVQQYSKDNPPPYPVTAVNGKTGDVSLNTSDLNNNSGFITNAVNDLVNYYTKDQTLTKEEIQELVSRIPKFSISVVSELPTAEIDTNILYFVPGGEDSDNLYTEYIFIVDENAPTDGENGLYDDGSGTWEILGTQRVDLTGYATETWVEDKIAAQEKMIPHVYSWANAELPFTEDEISDTASGAGLVVNPTNFADGKTYFRYHAGATSFIWTNPNPQKGSVTITARGISQWGGTGGTRLLTIYDDGTYGPALYIVVNGESQTVTVTTDPEKTLAKITGNYDLENWILLDMDVLSIVADYPAPGGSAEVTAESIENALGYTPADDAEVTELSEAITDKLDADKLPEAINTALEQAKASGEFDGEPGEKGNTGDKGDKGDKGDPGYTPVKGTDYFTESDKTELVSAVLAALPAAEGVGF